MPAASLAAICLPHRHGLAGSTSPQRLSITKRSVRIARALAPRSELAAIALEALRVLNTHYLCSLRREDDHFS